MKEGLSDATTQSNKIAQDCCTTLQVFKRRAAIIGNQGGDGPPSDFEQKVVSLQVFDIFAENTEK